MGDVAPTDQILRGLERHPCGAAVVYVGRAQIPPRAYAVINGSGKTLTSFMTAQLARDLHDFDEMLLVADRRDLGSETTSNPSKLNVASGVARQLPLTSSSTISESSAEGAAQAFIGLGSISVWSAHGDGSEQVRIEGLS